MSAIFYVTNAQGGLDLRSVVDDLGNMMITNAVKMLTSPDPLIRGVAQPKRFRRQRGQQVVGDFLLGS